MRLFVAIEIGDDVRRAAGRVIDELKRRVEGSAPHARVSWVAPERMHLTVRFIGEADAAVGRAVLAALELPLATAAFELTIAGTGSFPPGRPPRVLWAGLTKGLEQLRAVEGEVHTRLDPLPLPREEREYNPHLTLARVKHPAGLRASTLLTGLEDTTFGTVPVEAVTLFESRLSSTGPTHLALGRTPLKRS